MKAIDWYLICCFLFVFGVLVEYTFVLYLENVGQRKKKKNELQKKLEREEKAKVYKYMYTRKNVQVTSLQTSCNKSVHKVSTSCVRTACS